MAQDCARWCSGRTRSPPRGGSPRLWPYRSSGSFGSGRTAGYFWVYAIGEGRTSPFAGSHCRDPRTTVSQAGPQARAGSPGPWRYVQVYPSGFHRRDRNKHPFPSARKGVRGTACGAVGVRGQHQARESWAGGGRPSEAAAACRRRRPPSLPAAAASVRLPAGGGCRRRRPRLPRAAAADG